MDQWADAPGKQDAVASLKEREDCLAEAAKAEISATKAQWLIFADEWLKLAQAAGARPKREAATKAVAANEAVLSACAIPTRHRRSRAVTC